MECYVPSSAAVRTCLVRTAIIVTGARMKKQNSPVIIVGLLAGLAALMPTSAYAYLDPGTGAFAVQGLIAGIAGGLIAIRAYGKRVLGFFSRSKASPNIWPDGSSSDRDA